MVRVELSALLCWQHDKYNKRLGKSIVKRHCEDLSDCNQGITKPTIRRLTRRILGLVYEKNSGVLIVAKVTRSTVTCTEHAKKKDCNSYRHRICYKTTGKKTVWFREFNRLLDNCCWTFCLSSNAVNVTKVFFLFRFQAYYISEFALKNLKHSLNLIVESEIMTAM